MEKREYLISLIKEEEEPLKTGGNGVYYGSARRVKTLGECYE